MLNCPKLYDARVEFYSRVQVSLLPTVTAVMTRKKKHGNNLFDETSILGHQDLGRDM